MADDVSDSTTSGAQLPHENEPGNHAPGEDAEQPQGASAEAPEGGDGVAPGPAGGSTGQHGTSGESGVAGEETVTAAAVSADPASEHSSGASAEAPADRAAPGGAATGGAATDARASDAGLTDGAAADQVEHAPAEAASAGAETAAAKPTPAKTELARPVTPDWPVRLRGIGFGGDYNPEQWPMEVRLEDVQLMGEAGVNIVSLAIFSWATIETREGRYEWAWLDNIMDRLAAAGVRVALATATASPPPWLTMKHPEILPRTAEGLTLSQGARQSYSPSSTVYRDYAIKMAKAIAERYGQ